MRGVEGFMPKKNLVYVTLVAVFLPGLAAAQGVLVM